MIDVFFKKPMIYEKERKNEVICCGKAYGYKFFILNLGTHPCAYIEIPPYSKFYDKLYIELEDDETFDIVPHGGFTYSSSYLQGVNESGRSWFLGWDYAHCFDYMGYYEDKIGDNKKWSTDEILNEIIEISSKLKYEEIKEYKMEDD